MKISWRFVGKELGKGALTALGSLFIYGIVIWILLVKYKDSIFSKVVETRIGPLVAAEEPVEM